MAVTGGYMLLPDDDAQRQLDLFEWSAQSRLNDAKEYGFGGFDEFYTIDQNTDDTDYSDSE
jgi:hypothetical protein